MKSIKPANADTTRKRRPARRKSTAEKPPNAQVPAVADVVATSSSAVNGQFSTLTIVQEIPGPHPQAPVSSYSQVPANMTYSSAVSAPSTTYDHPTSHYSLQEFPSASTSQLIHSSSYERTTPSSSSIPPAQYYENSASHDSLPQYTPVSPSETHTLPSTHQSYHEPVSTRIASPLPSPPTYAPLPPVPTTESSTLPISHSTPADANSNSPVNTPREEQLSTPAQTRPTPTLTFVPVTVPATGYSLRPPQAQSGSPVGVPVHVPAPRKAHPSPASVTSTFTQYLPSDSEPPNRRKFNYVPPTRPEPLPGRGKYKYDPPPPECKSCHKTHVQLMHGGCEY